MVVQISVEVNGKRLARLSPISPGASACRRQNRQYCGCFIPALTIQNGWSRAVLVHQIESGLFQRQGKALTNFDRTLPAPQSELAQQILKDPYNFDFLALGPQMLERDLERGLIEHLRDLILELGKGFAFVGSQYHLEVGGQDYYLDLLFYHLRLRCYVIIDLKIEDFKP